MSLRLCLLVMVLWTHKKKIQDTGSSKQGHKVLGVSPRTHLGAAEFQKAGMLPVAYRVEQLQLNHMFNVKTGSVPDYMMTQFQSAISSHNTRNSAASFYVPRVNGFGKNTFIYTGVKSWNSLPSQIRSLTSKSSFKSNVKAHLMSKNLSNDSNNFIYY